MLRVKMTKRHYLKKNNLIESYIFISQYHRYNAELRGVIIKTLIDKYNLIYDKIDLNPDIKIKLLSEIELEIMCKVMELTESLASISYALTEDESQIKENMVDFNHKQGLDAKHFYKNIRRNNKFYYKLFTYPEIKNIPISDKEKEFLKEVHSTNIQVIKDLFRLIRKFRGFNTVAYNKNRHSRPILIGVPINNKDYYAFSGIISRRKTKNKKIITTLVLHGKPILNRYVNLAEFIIQLQKDLLWNRIHCFECDGFKIPIQTSYFEISQETRNILEGINNKCKDSVIRQNIKSQIKMNIKMKIFIEKINFYNNEFESIKRGLNNRLEDLSKKIIIG